MCLLLPCRLRAAAQWCLRSPCPIKALFLFIYHVYLLSLLHLTPGGGFWGIHLLGGSCSCRDMYGLSKKVMKEFCRWHLAQSGTKQCLAWRRAGMRAQGFCFGAVIRCRKEDEWKPIVVLLRARVCCCSTAYTCDSLVPAEQRTSLQSCLTQCLIRCNQKSSVRKSKTGLQKGWDWASDQTTEFWCGGGESEEENVLSVLKAVYL